MRARPLIVLFLLASAARSQDYSAWSQARDLWYDTSPTGANTATDVADFPALVRLDTSNFPFGEARDSGQDLRFSLPDGTPLPYEIDRFDRAARKAEIWVRIPRVPANSKGRLARMHWGHATAPAASAPNAVFPAAEGFVNVWHLRGRFPTPRANSVAGGAESVPIGYDSDEQVEGIIGWADSLDGAAAGGDHLQHWGGAIDYSKGATFSVWAHTVKATAWARIFDLGNGPGQDNVWLGRGNLSNDLIFELSHGGTRKTLTVPGALAVGKWQFFAVTVDGGMAVLYGDGEKLGELDLGGPIPTVLRQQNYLGKSASAGHGYYAGKLDEPVFAKVSRGPDWIRLAYANQKADQAFLSFTPIEGCVSRFEGPADTVVAEGEAVSLAGIADCATRYGWTALSGPVPPLLDPDARALTFAIPRIAGDTVIRLRFTAVFGDSTRTRDVAVRIEEAIPEPALSLPAEHVWNRRDTLYLRPEIANRAALEASRAPDLRWAWSLGGGSVDTAWLPEGLALLPGTGNGAILVDLCVDNGGPEQCVRARVIPGPQNPSALRPFTGKRKAARGKRYDLAGRSLRVSGRGPAGDVSRPAPR